MENATIIYPINSVAPDTSFSILHTKMFNDKQFSKIGCKKETVKEIRTSVISRMNHTKLKSQSKLKQLSKCKETKKHSGDMSLDNRKKQKKTSIEHRRTEGNYFSSKETRCDMNIRVFMLAHSSL